MQPIKYDPTKSRGKKEKRYFQAQLKCRGEAIKREACEAHHLAHLNESASANASTVGFSSDCGRERQAEERCMRWFLCPQEYVDLQRSALEDGGSLLDMSTEQLFECRAKLLFMQDCLDGFQKEAK